MKTESNFVDAETTNSIGTIVLNNPARHNALSKELIDGICSVLELMQQEDVRVVVLRAPAGSKVFSAGHDIRELPTNGRDPLTYDDPLRRVIRTIEHFPAPVIAMIEGSVWGGACELVMSCDIIVAADDCTFARRSLQHLGDPELSQYGRHAALQGDVVHRATHPSQQVALAGNRKPRRAQRPVAKPYRVHGHADRREFAPGRQPAQRGAQAPVRVAQSWS
jgi:hypothetical protein